MREIKFRVWDDYNRIMHTENYKVLQSMAYYAEHKDNENRKRVKYMQYTGLKVNRDAELFEGDIVEVKGSVYYGWKQGREYFKVNAVVVYDESEMRYRFLAHTEKFGKQYVDFDKSIRQSYKIIGNVFENPELLEEN